MKGAEIVIKCLEAEGVRVVFAYPGRTSMLLHHALLSSPIRVVLPRHEQGAAFEASGYARISGQVGVCMSTSGPGATNLVTGITDAWMDSIPLVIITAQVNQSIIGKNAFQETDIIGMTRPVVKHSFLALGIDDLPEIIKDAFALASTGRPGPVVIDIPIDVLEKDNEPIFPASPNLRAMFLPPEMSKENLEHLRKALNRYRRPCIIAGGGVIHSDASEALRDFAERWNVPVATTMMGLGAFKHDHPLSLGMLGMHGTESANKAVAECDLLIALGVRFSDRVTGEVSHFAENAKIVHIDIDESEINKNKHADIAIVSDIGTFLHRIEHWRAKPELHSKWIAQIAKWKEQFPLSYTMQGKLTGPGIVSMLNELTEGKATIVTGVGQHQLWCAQIYNFNHVRQFLTSGGLGAMGFGLPAAIGAQIARPNETVILVDGDGSFQMNIQELATLFVEGLNVKMIIFNNQMLGMVAQMEDYLFNGQHGNTDMEVRKTGRPYPDFCAIAGGYGIPAIQVTRYSQLKDAIKKMLSSSGPFLLDCVIPKDDHVAPIMPYGKTMDEIIKEQEQWK